VTGLNAEQRTACSQVREILNSESDENHQLQEMVTEALLIGAYDIVTPIKSAGQEPSEESLQKAFVMVSTQIQPLLQEQSI
jgi:hypothetical protein